MVGDGRNFMHISCITIVTIVKGARAQLSSDKKSVQVYIIEDFIELQ